VSDKKKTKQNITKKLSSGSGTKWRTTALR